MAPPPPPPTAAMPSLPPGFRFHPTDAELITHYLANQSSSNPIPAPIIAEVNIYRSNPWELPSKALFGARDGEWFFFSPRDRKYPNGARPNRAAGDGYWKATGTDKPIIASDSASGSSSAIVGVKKALVFYRGKPPRGVKTDWIMHEYRLASSSNGACKRRSSAGSSSSMRLDDWVLCRIHKKSSNSSTNLHNFSSSSEHEQEESSTVEESSMNNNTMVSSPKSEAFDGGNDEELQELRPMAIAKSCSITDLLNTVDYASLSHLLLDGAETATYYDQLPAPGTETEESPLIYTPPNPWETLNCSNNNNNSSLSYLNDDGDAIAVPQLAEQGFYYSNGDQYVNGVKRKRSSGGGYCNQLQQQVADDHLLAGNSSSSGLQYSGMLIHPFLMNSHQLQM